MRRAIQITDVPVGRTSTADGREGLLASGLCKKDGCGMPGSTAFRRTRASRQMLLLRARSNSHGQRRPLDAQTRQALQHRLTWRS